MVSNPRHITLEDYPELRLPIGLLSRYLFFLTRRPISRSNTHYLSNRLKGLKSLAGSLQDTGISYLDEVVHNLNAMNPVNFYRLAERLQFTLLPLIPFIDELPTDVRITNEPPEIDFFKNSRRILILLGPAIGIGDEVILFPMPGWIKTVHPQAEITVLSAYRDLWQRVDSVDHLLHYDDYNAMLSVLRGEEPYDQYDLVILADFERPDLYPSISHEARLPRYAELSLGAQSLFLVDNLQGWVHRAPRVNPYFANFYNGLDYLMHWSGLSTSMPDRFSATLPANPWHDQGLLQVFVSPFTSKQDPYQPYWNRLICSLFPQPPDRRIRFVIDPGPNYETRHFANDLLRSARARLPSEFDLQILDPEKRLPLPFQDVFTHLEKSDVVLCADSYIAHIAPLLNCTTFVICRTGLEKWHVPHPSSYYLDAEAPCDDIANAIQQVLKELTHPGYTLEYNQALISDSEFDLETITRVFPGLLDSDHQNGQFESLFTAYCEFNKAYAVVVDRLQNWPSEYSSLFADFPYHKFRHSINQSHFIPDYLRLDFVLHVRDHYWQWQNTNLKKFLTLALRQFGMMSESSEGRVNEPEDLNHK
jgi:hypothetical protein